MQTAFDTAWKAISGFFSDTWADIKEVWQVASEWFNTTIIDPIRKAFNRMLTGSDDGTGEGGLFGIFKTVFSGIKDFIKGIFNGIIRLINGINSGVVDGLNGLIATANTLGGVLPGWKTIPALVAPQIPELAKGAIIPPNSRFLAILGDQRAGKNIEAPEGLIRQIIQEEMGAFGQQQIAITFEGSLGELVRQLKPALDRENSRIGRSLIKVAS